MSNSNDKFQWISCDGGPLLLVEEKYLSAWEGSGEPSEGRYIEADFRWRTDNVATDYDRACDVSDDWLGLIDIGEGQGLVLGGEEPATTWLPLPNENSGMLVRWCYAENEDDAINAAKSISKDKSDGDVFMSIGDSDLILLAACEAADDNIYERLKIILPQGSYAISTIEFKDEFTSIVCHKFRKIAEPEDLKGK